MPMNPQLAALYGTNVEEQDVEKIAAAKLAEELSDEGELDTADMTDEQVEELAAQVLASEDDEEAAVEEPEKTSAAVEETDEAQEKLAEADYLGRVMAHAYVHELREIEKTADMGDVIPEAKKKVFRHLEQEGKGSGKGRLGNVGQYLRANKGKALGVAGVAAGAGAAYAGKKAYDKFKGKKKAASAEPSALDILAERRALEILKENGIELEQPKAEEAEVAEKTSASEQEMQVLANAVEERAFALLQANGYIQAEEETKEEAKQE